MICSYIGCKRLATWFNEYANPFRLRTLDEANIIPLCRMPICHVHKIKDSQPMESIEMRDSDHVFPVTIKPPDYYSCKHLQTEIDPELRTIHCVKCREKLDPIEVLIEISKSGSAKNYKINAIAEADRKRKQKYEKQKRKTLK